MKRSPLPSLHQASLHQASGRGFTLVELLVAAAVLAVVMGIGFRSFASFLQERRLRQAALELVSYLQTARSRAMKQGQSDGLTEVRICEIQRTDLSFLPASTAGNGCNDAQSAVMSTLDLAAVSGAQGLAISGSSENITFTNHGLLSSWNPGVSITAAQIAMPRLLYLSGANTDIQYCVFIDFVSIRLGYRNGSSGSCTFTSG